MRKGSNIIVFLFMSQEISCSQFHMAMEYGYLDDLIVFHLIMLYDDEKYQLTIRSFNYNCGWVSCCITTHSHNECKVNR